MGRPVLRLLGAAMESRFRYRFFPPTRILKGADIRPGQNVLEVGCGTGFFTVAAARLIGDLGCLVAMDVVPASVKMVSERVETIGLENVRVVEGDAMNTALSDESMDAVLLFGVIPAPMLPLKRLLPEMHRILKPDGTMAVWPSSWVRHSIVQSRLFTYAGKRNGVWNFRRS